MVYNRQARALQAATARSVEEKKARFVANVRAQVAKEFSGQISKLKEENQDLSSRYKTLQGELDTARAELTAAAENYDTLASVNQNLQEAVNQATDRAEKAEQEARLARAEADSPSAIKAIEELLDAEKEKNAKLTKHITNLKSQLGRAHQRIGAVHQEYEALLEGQDDGTVAVISAEGVELRGPYTEATVEDVAHTLGLAFKLFVQEGSNANIRTALS
ncbi:hypothetical protein [Rothia nasimurium]|uniref:hypothetical protein n=1 Tax=Rothia nasimurium TaxID=85336 RepID=UPI001F1D9905|nr:hypothetical protein [Rothia nasimurium]